MCDELKTVLETDLHTEMWIQVKLTLCFKLFAELEKQIEEIQEILMQDQHKRKWVEL